jgi:hypothetical protein
VKQLQANDRQALKHSSHDEARQPGPLWDQTSALNITKPQEKSMKNSKPRADAGCESWTLEQKASPNPEK